MNTAHADLTPMTGAAVAPNIAEITISDTGVAVALEIYVEDIRHFEDLLPDNWVPQGPDPRKNEVERMRRFAEHGLSIRADQGRILPVSVTFIEPRLRVDRAPPNAGKIEPITGRMFPKPPDDPRVVYTELFYDFGGQKPERLEIVPPLDSDGNAFLSIGMIVFDREVPVTDFRYLSANAWLTMAWDDPWYTRFDNPNLRRHHRFPVMTFIYAEPYEIRHEALLRVRDAARIAGITLEGDFLSEAQRADLLATLPDLVNARSPMTIDGVPVKPDFERASVLRVGPSGLIFLQEGENIRTDAAIIGLIYSAPTSQFAKEARVEWSLFSDTVQKIPAQAIDAAGPFIMELTPEEPELIWTNHFKRPPYPEVAAIVVDAGPDRTWLMIGLAIASAGLAGLVIVSLIAPHRIGRRPGALAAILAVACALAIPAMRTLHNRAVFQIDDDQIIALTSDLLRNIYRAFDFKLEDQVYDRLDLTLTGEVLEQVYLGQRAALRVERAGGAQARVDALEVFDVEKLPAEQAGSLRLDVDWGISGIVGHWGHNHRRSNDYTAELLIRPVEGKWKIDGFDIKSQERRQ